MTWNSASYRGYLQPLGSSLLGSSYVVLGPERGTLLQMPLLNGRVAQPLGAISPPDISTTLVSPDQWWLAYASFPMTSLKDLGGSGRTRHLNERLGQA